MKDSSYQKSVCSYLIEQYTVQAIRNKTLISQKRTETKPCEFVRSFWKISEFAN